MVPSDALGGPLDRTSRPPVRLARAAWCVVLGIVAADHLPWFGVWWSAAALALLLSRAIRRRRPAWRLACLGVTAFAGAAAWSVVNQYHGREDDLRRAAPRESEVVRLEGVLRAPARAWAQPAGSLAHFHYRGPSTLLTVDVDSIRDRFGRRFPVRGRVRVRVSDACPTMLRGDRVTLTGMFRAPMPPMNPGGFDQLRWARAHHLAGTVDVPNASLVRITGDRSGSPARWRDQWRQHVETRLLQQPVCTGDRGALLNALLLGNRDPASPQLEDAFRHAGLAHLLAISGMHLGILVGLVVLVVRMTTRGQRRPLGVIVIVVVLGYLLLVESRPPVLRAGMMAAVAAIGMTARRRWRPMGIVAGSAIVLAVARPADVLQPGFQLSFAVVTMLVWAGPDLYRRWFPSPEFPGRHDALARAMRRFVAPAVCVSVLAWAAAAPIVVYHFGLFAPWAVPASLLALPLATVVLGLGYAMVVLASVFGTTPSMLNALLAAATDLLVGLAHTVDALPGAGMHVPAPSIAWTIGMLAWVITWARRGWEPYRVARVVSLALLIGWLMWPRIEPGPTAELVMLAVGNGSCYLVRSGGRAVVFDAGSGHDPDAGRRTIVPALRRLNVSSIDAIAISHANLDHYSSVLEVVDAYDVSEVLVTPTFARSIERAPGGSARHLVTELEHRGVTLTPVALGHTLAWGRVSAAWLHPASGVTFANDNDGSMVVRLDVGRHRLLLTGDIETAGIESLMRRSPGLRADIVELPHHGSDLVAAHRFVAALQPRIVLQSTGRRRLESDPWPASLGPDVDRLLTARDGACRVVFERDGAITLERFREHNR